MMRSQVKLGTPEAIEAKQHLIKLFGESVFEVGGVCAPPRDSHFITEDQLFSYKGNVVGTRGLEDGHIPAGIWTVMNVDQMGQGIVRIRLHYLEQGFPEKRAEAFVGHPNDSMIDWRGIRKID
ncbi:MAG TPA: hypothetical protein VGP13_00015 [Candidatus Paceibacterota bacterium]|jgi:hypothetical protein|nr:hypothetical protein [Candidatus Paceibacterota bacterium]